jgi:hypothetical protein
MLSFFYYFIVKFIEKSKKRWEELIAYFPLLTHGPHRKRRLKIFFISARTTLPSCYLATIGGYRDRPTSTRVQQFYCCVYSLLQIDDYRAVVYEWKEAYILPSLWLTTIEGIHIQTHRLMEGTYEVLRWDALGCHDIPSFKRLVQAFKS